MNEGLKSFLAWAFVIIAAVVIVGFITGDIKVGKPAVSATK